MFNALPPVPVDPILGLSLAYAADPNPDKVDLGVGVYRTEQGETPVLDCIRRAEAMLYKQETTKAYQGTAGNTGFNSAIQELVFGPLAADSRICTLQAPGGCGSLRLAAELVKRSHPGATVWFSSPTWANHGPLLGSSGLAIREYPYFDAMRNNVEFDAMMACLRQVPAGDVVLLHGCCHNPCGADLSREQWNTVAELARERGLIPFIDLAYQGFGDGLEEDAYAVRLMTESVPELLVAISCSKNFGLYRERTGALSVVADSATQAERVFAHLQSLARGIYSMPPAHGASLVELVLGTVDLRAQWQCELAEMRNRILHLRADLAHALAGFGDFSFITRQNGMFSFLGLNENQVQRLASDYSVYMVNSSRVNIAGINAGNLQYLANAIGAVL